MGDIESEEYISFQIIDIDFDDIDVDMRHPDLNSEDCMSDNLWKSTENGYPREFVVTLYGVTSDNKKIVCNVYNFHPYFYVNFNQKEKAKKTEIESIISRTIHKVVTPVKLKPGSNEKKSGKKQYRNVLYGTHTKARIKDECKIVSSKDFYYYSKSKKDFYKMSFNTYQAFKVYAKATRLYSKNNKKKTTSLLSVFSIS